MAIKAKFSMPHPAIVCSGPQLLSVIEELEAGTYPQPDDAIWRGDLPRDLAVRLAKATGATDEQIAEICAEDDGGVKMSNGRREAWQAGEVAYFEYHCLESHDSSDAPAWYRSHQQVTVLARGDDENFGGTLTERADAGCPNVYTVRFADGLEWSALEDELLTGPQHYERPDPPAMPR